MTVTWEGAADSTQDSFKVAYQIGGSGGFSDASCPSSPCEFSITDPSGDSVAGVSVTVKVTAVVGDNNVESDGATRTGNTSKF